GKPRPASDQYALAITVYEWLCSERPFQGDSFITIAMQQLSANPPPLRTKSLTIPVGVEQVVMRALAKEPEQRYPSIAEFAEALKQAMHIGEDPVQPGIRPGEASNAPRQTGAQIAVKRSQEPIITPQHRERQTGQPVTPPPLITTPPREQQAAPLLVYH